MKNKREIGECNGNPSSQPKVPEIHKHPTKKSTKYSGLPENECAAAKHCAVEKCDEMKIATIIHC